MVELLDKLKLKRDDAAYMGDDVVDLLRDAPGRPLRQRARLPTDSAGKFRLRNATLYVYIRVVDPEKHILKSSIIMLLYYPRPDYTSKCSCDMELDEILYNRDFINTKLRDILDHSTDAWV